MQNLHCKNPGETENNWTSIFKNVIKILFPVFLKKNSKKKIYIYINIYKMIKS